MVDTNMIRIYNWMIVRKMYGFIKVGKHWRIRTNKETKDILQGHETAKFRKLP